MSITIPKDRADRHGGEEFYSSGLKFAETLVLWGNLGPGQRILDVGCGPGRVAIGIGELVGHDQTYVGLDVIEKDIRVATENISSVYTSFHFKHLNVYNGLYNPRGEMRASDVILPVDEGSFDFAFAASLFTHMFWDDTKRYLSELSRAMRKGGACLTTWFLISPEIEGNLTSGKARFSFAHDNGDGTYTDRIDRPEEVIAFRQEAVEGLFREAGFDITAFHRGAWSRHPSTANARHSQDCLVCRKR